MQNYLKTNPKQSRNKYGNLKTEYNGYIYMSGKEAKYAMLLDKLKKAHNVYDRVDYFENQPPFQIILNGVKICKYYGDFKVFYCDGRVEIIDVKGVKTQLYRLKKRLVEAQYGIKIKEV